MKPMRIRLPVCCIILLSACWRAAGQQEAEAELRRLAEMAPRFRIVDIPAAPGEVALSAEESLTIDDLRGVQLDPDPPVLGKPAQPYPPNMTDAYAPGEAPYVAEGIAPFRFRYFNNEFSYGGWHNWAMCDYASAHGFNILSSYNHSPLDWTHVPKGTKWMKWGGFVNWEKWLEEHDIPPLRYDMLVDVDVVKELLDAGTFKYVPGFQSLMIDMEHRRLSPEQLRNEPWYPSAAGEAQRTAFERKYYAGYAKTYTASVEAARREGWPNISIYGWQPFGRTWFGLEKVQLDPATDWAWNAFGKTIYDSVDILNPSVYCFYRSQQNVAYTLANIDLNMEMEKGDRALFRQSEGAASAKRAAGRKRALSPFSKPVRPYYWTLLHGGGGGWRWWRNQPLTNEEARAMITLGFFTGFDGFVLWNWSGTGNHHRPRPIEPDADVMVGEAFELAPQGQDDAAERHAFARYDVLHIKSVGEDGLVTFQPIDPLAGRDKYGISDERPTYVMAREELLAHLRPSSEPVSALIEGMALAKPLEYLLRHGEAKVDVPAQRQFAETLPIVRRVKLGRYHVLATYDPAWATQEQPRRIVLTDFDGHKGLTVSLPADAQTRVFVLRER